MDFRDRFPCQDQHSWQTTTPGYWPNSGLTAQRCEECGVLVDYRSRQAHHDWHELIAQATATS